MFGGHRGVGRVAHHGELEDARELAPLVVARGRLGRREQHRAIHLLVAAEADDLHRPLDAAAARAPRRDQHVHVGDGAVADVVDELHVLANVGRVALVAVEEHAQQRRRHEGAAWRWCLPRRRWGGGATCAAPIDAAPRAQATVRMATDAARRRWSRRVVISC